MTATMQETFDMAMESSEVVINILSDPNLTDEEKRELIDALLLNGDD